jgi:hypothetical protein
MTNYKWINKLGIKLNNDDVNSVNRESLQQALKDNGIEDKFSDYFGIQTISINGPYAHDVEAVFVRIFENKRTGTQLIWD